jgi:hypothetical protein
MVVAAPRPAAESTRSKSGALSLRACSARSTTRSTFSLALPERWTPSNLLYLSRTTLAFRPPPGYGSGGLGGSDRSRDRLQLHRVDNDCNYEPANVHWANPSGAKQSRRRWATEQQGDRERSRIATSASSAACRRTGVATTLVGARPFRRTPHLGRLAPPFTTAARAGRALLPTASCLYLPLSCLPRRAARAAASV